MRVTVKLQCPWPCSLRISQVWQNTWLQHVTPKRANVILAVVRAHGLWNGCCWHFTCGVSCSSNSRIWEGDMVEECHPWMRATGFAPLKCSSAKAEFTPVLNERVSLHQGCVSPWVVSWTLLKMDVFHSRVSSVFSYAPWQTRQHRKSTSSSLPPALPHSQAFFKRSIGSFDQNNVSEKGSRQKCRSLATAGLTWGPRSPGTGWTSKQTCSLFRK